MGLYEQHMKHWKNHRKDRYTQETFLPSTASGYHMKDFVIVTKEDEEYIISAWNDKDAKERFLQALDVFTVLSVREV